MSRLPLFLAGLAAAMPLAAAEPASLATAFAGGKFSVQARARSETVAQSGLLDARALTLRTRLGYTTAAFRGWQAGVEGEHLVAADGDAYSQAGLNPAAARRAVVADPETTELNQLWLAFAPARTAVTVGRQKLVLDQARFIGDVGWRQNQQTFDAAVLRNRDLPGTTVTYAYLDRIHRVFSRRHAQGRWSSDSHLIHVASTAVPGATLTGYAYLLDFAGAAANSCATFGASAAGTRKLDTTTALAWRLEAAAQSDYGASRLAYSAHYVGAEFGLTGAAGGLHLGYERLGSDRGVGFKTPLATLHAFNGWADLFLATPAAGLRNPYVKAVAPLPGALQATAVYHWFESDTGRARLGREFDAMLAGKFPRGFTAAVKFADFRGASPLWPDVKKVWLQLEFAL